MRTRVRLEIGRLLASMWPLRRSAHLTDRELVQATVNAAGEDPPAAGEAHLAVCVHCAARVRTLQAGLDRVTAAAESAFDDTVPAWRLVQQRRRIMHRIRHAACRHGSARILRFPTAAVPAVAGAHPARWRLSLAAAAGLLLTLGIGQAIDDRRAPPASPRSAAVAPSQPLVGPPAGQPQTMADEQFMRELEDALTTSRVTPLVALDELTPRMRAAAIDIR